MVSVHVVSAMGSGVEGSFAVVAFQRGSSMHRLGVTLQLAPVGETRWTLGAVPGAYIVVNGLELCCVVGEKSVE